MIGNLVAGVHEPQKVYTFSFKVASIIPKSVKCIHSATKVTICSEPRTATSTTTTLLSPGRAYEPFYFRNKKTYGLLHGLLKWIYKGTILAS